MATITLAASGTVTVDIAAGAAPDGGGNPSAAAVQSSIVADLTPVPALPVIGAIALALLCGGGARRRRELTAAAGRKPRLRPVRRHGGGRPVEDNLAPCSPRCRDHLAGARGCPRGSAWKSAHRTREGWVGPAARRKHVGVAAHALVIGPGRGRLRYSLFHLGGILFIRLMRTAAVLVLAGLTAGCIARSPDLTAGSAFAAIPPGAEVRVWRLGSETAEPGRFIRADDEELVLEGNAGTAAVFSGTDTADEADLPGTQHNAVVALAATNDGGHVFRLLSYWVLVLASLLVINALWIAPAL